MQFIHSLLQKRAISEYPLLKLKRKKKNPKISLTQYTNCPNPILHATYRIKMRHRRRLGVQIRQCNKEKGRAKSGGRRAVCVQMANCEVWLCELAKVPDSLELSTWSLVKPEGMRRRRPAVVRLVRELGELQIWNFSQSVDCRIVEA